MSEFDFGDENEDVDAENVDDSRSIIRIKESEIPRMVQEAIAALSQGDHNLYQRAGELVTITKEPDAPCALDHVEQRIGNDIIMRPGTPRVRKLPGPVLVERLATVATWHRFDGRAKEWRAVAPHGRTCGIVYAREDWSTIKPIRGILECPSLRPDITIIDRPGYDAATRFVLLPSVAFPAIQDRPAQQQAADALRRLWIELFCDFPAQGLGEAPQDWRETDPLRHEQYERARKLPDAFVGIGALLSMIARPAILGAVPATIFEAATQGSGKTLQIHAIVIVATGRPAGVATFPASRGEANEEELEKMLSAYARAGARVIAFDNVKCPLGGPALEKTLTAIDTIDLRVLGSSEIETLPWSAIVIVSGNNITMNDDVAQRSLVSRLESPREDPRGRPSSDFYHPDLLDSIRAQRPQLVADALTILRAFGVCSPDARPNTGMLGSFEAWSRLIPPAIAYAGGPNILDARPKCGGDSSDSDTEAHATLLRQWPYAAPVKAADVLHLLFDTEYEQIKGKTPPDGRDDMRAAVRALTHAADGRAPNVNVFGNRLAKLRGKIRDGRKLMAEIDRTKAKLWHVVDTRPMVTATSAQAADETVDDADDPYKTT